MEERAFPGSHVTAVINSAADVVINKYRMYSNTEQIIHWPLEICCNQEYNMTSSEYTSSPMHHNVFNDVSSLFNFSIEFKHRMRIFQEFSFF